LNIENTVKNLKGRGFAVSRFATKGEAVDYLADSIKGTTVGIGGSMTLEQLGLYERLTAENTVSWHWFHKSPEIIRAATDSKVYITSANAVAESGEIVNIDGRGNRVAGTLYGKQTVYIIVGTNKLCDDLDSAIWRARNIAAPKNAQRLGMKTPCAVRGDKCYDCRSPQRICRGLVVLYGPMLDMEKVEVIIIDEELGA
jgi:hypothetical protein